MPNFFEDKKIISLNTIVTTLVVTVVTVGAGIFVTRLTGPVPISVSQTLTEKQSSFDVTGTSEVSAVPDEAQITIGVEVNQPTVISAQEEVNRITNQMIDTFKQIGLKEAQIKTTSYSVYPERDYESLNNRITSYRVSSQLLIKVTDFNLLSQVIDNATALGANQIGGISFTLSQEKKDELIKQARKEAIQDAKNDAQELASLAGLKLGRIIDVSENSNQNQPIYRSYDSVMPLAAGGIENEATTVNPGTSEFTYQVTLSYEVF